MRLNFMVLWLLVSSLNACRSTYGADERRFADGRASKPGEITPDIKAPPSDPVIPSKPGFPDHDPTPTAGPFSAVCETRQQLPSPEALTVEAILEATHQTECGAGEAYLRDPRTFRLMIESRRLIELTRLSVLRAYPQLLDVWICTAEGVERNCPLRTDQTCHFTNADRYRTLSD